MDRELLNTTSMHFRRSLPALGLLSLGLFGCPAPTWHLDATLPARRAPEPGQALRFHVAASATPFLDAGTTSVEEDETGGYRARSHSGDSIVLFEGEELRNAQLVGDCDGGCSAECEPPPGAFVRVDEPEVLSAWKVEDGRDVPFPEDKDETGGCAVKLRVARERSAVGTLRWVVVPSDAADAGRVSLEVSGGLLWVGWQCSHRTSRTFRLEAVLSDVCTTSPCAPPADAKVSITSVDVVPF